MTLTINAENTQIIQNNSSTRRLVIIIGDKGGVGNDIQMPELSEDAYYYLDKNNMSFAEGIQQTGSLAVKGRITAWMKKFKQDIAPAKELLGLGDVRF